MSSEPFSSSDIVLLYWQRVALCTVRSGAARRSKHPRGFCALARARPRVFLIPPDAGDPLRRACGLPGRPAPAQESSRRVAVVPEIVTAVAQLAGAVLFVSLLGVLLLVVMVLTKDFVVPQMMFERVTCTEGWGRLWTRIRSEPMNYVGYVLLKIVLAIAALMAFVILMVILALIVAIPAAIAIAAGVVVFKAAAANILVIVIGIALASLNCGARDRLLRRIRQALPSRSFSRHIPCTFSRAATSRCTRNCIGNRYLDKPRSSHRYVMRVISG